MASIQRRGQTWQYAISYTVESITKRRQKGGFNTKKEAQIAAMEHELKIKRK